MARSRGAEEGTASLVGRLLILIAGGKETSATLAEKLGISPRQVNRYVNQLQEAGWRIERHGARRRGDIRMELGSPRILLPALSPPCAGPARDTAGSGLAGSAPRPARTAARRRPRPSRS
jgi:hypothetical protein